MNQILKYPLPSKAAPITRLDLFLGFNSLLFLIMCTFFYYDRFIIFHGKATIHEFFLYAAAIFSFIFCVWVKFRTLHVQLYILLLIEIGILIHFAGGFVEIDGSRLYDFRFSHVRYDKFVHLINSIFASFVLIYLFTQNNYTIAKLISATIILCVLGLGALIEILEFVVSLTVDNNGVGTYVNNMLDLIANLIGSSCGIAMYHLYKNRKRSR